MAIMSRDTGNQPRTTRRLLVASALLVAATLGVAALVKQSSKAAPAADPSTTTTTTTTRAATPPVAAAPTAWAFHGGGPLLGQATDLGPPPMKLRWTYHADEDGDAAIEGAVAIAGALAYAADGKGVLLAIVLAHCLARGC